MKEMFQPNMHEDKIVELALWAFGFGGSYGGHIFLHTISIFDCINM
jgi:hypothetical protein